MSKLPVSGLVICLNEADRIARCLDSLAFCDEIIVVDSGSTDGTREIARRYTDRVIEHPFMGYSGQKNFAMEHAKHDWVLCLDADEALAPEAVAATRAALEREDPAVAGYAFERVAFYLGVWHEYGEWSNDWQLRLFRRSRGGSFGGVEPHDHVNLEGTVVRLPGRLQHWTYRSLSEHIQTTDRFSGRMARSYADHGLRFRYRDLFFRPVARFLKGYVLKQGFREGLPGFIVSAATAYYVFMKYAKLWELERAAPTPKR